MLKVWWNKNWDDNKSTRCCHGFKTIDNGQKLTTRSTTLLVIAAFTFVAQEEKKQMWQGAELFIILAFNFASLEKMNQDDDELNSLLSWLWKLWKKIHDDDELTLLLSWPSPLLGWQPKKIKPKVSPGGKTVSSQKKSLRTKKRKKGQEEKKKLLTK